MKTSLKIIKIQKHAMNHIKNKKKLNLYNKPRGEYIIFA